VRDIQLLLVPLREGQRSEAVFGISFLLAGEYTEMSPSLIGGELSALRSSILLRPVSTQERILVFHVAGWWNSEGDTYEFRFQAGQSYEVFLLYRLDRETRWHQISIFTFPGDWDAITTLPIPGPGGGILSPGLGENWDYYDFSKPKSRTD